MASVDYPKDGPTVSLTPLVMRLNRAKAALASLTEIPVSKDVDVQLHSQQVRRAYDEFEALSREYEARWVANPDLRHRYKRARLAFRTKVNAILRTCYLIGHTNEDHDDDLDEVGDTNYLRSSHGNVPKAQEAPDPATADGPGEVSSHSRFSQGLNDRTLLDFSDVPRESLVTIGDATIAAATAASVAFVGDAAPAASPPLDICDTILDAADLVSLNQNHAETRLQTFEQVSTKIDETNDHEVGTGRASDLHHEECVAEIPTSLGEKLGTLRALDGAEHSAVPTPVSLVHNLSTSVETCIGPTKDLFEGLSLTSSLLHEHRLRESVSLVPLNEFSCSTRNEYVGSCLSMLLLLVVLFDFIWMNFSCETYPALLRFQNYFRFPNRITHLHTRPPDVSDMHYLFGLGLGPELSLDSYQKRLRGKTLPPSALFDELKYYMSIQYSSTTLYPCWPRSVASGCQENIWKLQIKQ